MSISRLRWLLALLAVFGLAACDAANGGGPVWSPGTGTYAAHGVSFHYPAGWYQDTPGGEACGRGCQLLWTTGVGFDPPDSIYIVARRIGTRVTAQNLPPLIPYVTRAARTGFRHAGDRLLAGPQAVTVGGMPGLRFQGSHDLGASREQARALTLLSEACMAVGDVAAAQTASAQASALRTGNPPTAVTEA